MSALPSRFASTDLVRTLGNWLPLPAPQAAGMDFAERLSLWVGPVEAITLQAAHHALRQITATAPTPPIPPAPASTLPPRHAAPRADALDDDIQRVRAAIAAALSRDPLPPAVPGATHAERAKDAAYATYLQRQQALQRQMERLVEPLRDHVRQALAATSAPLRQLAALDAVMAQTLAPRQERLLAAAGALLERRYEQLRQAHRNALQAAALDESDDNPALWREPGGWLHRFEADWRQALRDELGLRLETTLGLVSALRAASTRVERNPATAGQPPATGPGTRQAPQGTRQTPTKT